MKGNSAQADSLRVIITEPKELGLGVWDENISAPFVFFFFPFLFLEGGGRQERIMLSCASDHLAGCLLTVTF